MKTSVDNKPVLIGPRSKKQEMYINSKADIVVFGGGAGSGKSYLGAMDMLKYTDDPKFRGCVVRRLSPQIHGPGGIFETFVSLHSLVYGDKLKIAKRDGIIRYPSGATISFRHCQHEDDKHTFQGWQISSCLADEGQQLTESQCVYLMSRLRSEAKMKPTMRITCNPSQGYLRKWLDWYLEGPDGMPIPERCGALRYFTMKDNEMVWGDTPEEVLSKVPNCIPLSFTFISANVYDNPVLMERQPEYVAWLEGQDRCTRAALLDGAWDVIQGHTAYFQKGWCKEVFDAPLSTKRVRAYDLSGSVPSEVYKDPDYTCGALLSKTKDSLYTIEDVKRLRERVYGVEQFILKQAEIDGPDVTIVIPVDPGSAGKSYASNLQKKIAEAGYHCKLHPMGNKNKMQRFKPFAAIAEAGFCQYVPGEYENWFFDELERFQGDGKGHDDAVDAISSAFWYLTRNNSLPDFSLPDFTAPSAFASVSAFN